MSMSRDETIEAYIRANRHLNPEQLQRLLQDMGIIVPLGSISKILESVKAH